jgi:hypothetical protein
MACKGNIHHEIESRIERVKEYMSDECCCDKECYTDELMESIMVNAMYDYIDTCDKPSTFLRLIVKCIERDLSLMEKICVAFTLTQVKRSDGEYINGFKEEFFK